MKHERLLGIVRRGDLRHLDPTADMTGVAHHLFAIADAAGCDCDVQLELWQHETHVEMPVGHHDHCARLAALR